MVCLGFTECAHSGPLPGGGSKAAEYPIACMDGRKSDFESACGLSPSLLIPVRPTVASVRVHEPGSTTGVLQVLVEQIMPHHFIAHFCAMTVQKFERKGQGIARACRLQAVEA